MRTRILLCAAAMGTIIAAVPASAHPGFDLTIAGPSSVDLGTEVTYAGRFTYIDQIPIPGQTVELLVDGAVAGSTVTGADGTWSHPVTFTTDRVHTVQAWAARGTLLETPSWAIGVRAGPPETVAAAISGVRAERADGAVEVVVDLSGSVLRGDEALVGATIDGWVQMTAPQNCWTDTPCAYPYWEDFEGFSTSTGTDGSFLGTVRFRLESADLAATCNVVVLRATIFYDTFEIWSDRTEVLCA